MKRPLIFELVRFDLLRSSEPCALWRRRLNRRAEGTLPPRHRAALEVHLTQCAECRAASAADRTLWESMGEHTGLLNHNSAHDFDDRVVSALNKAAVAANAPTAVEAFGWRIARKLVAYFRLSSRAILTAPPADPYRPLTSGMVFVSQLASGAATAAAITALCLMPALQPRMPSSAAHVSFAADQTAASPPISLEILLNNTAPRAALLWSAPQQAPLVLRHELPPLVPSHRPQSLRPRRDARPLPPMG